MKIVFQERSMDDNLYIKNGFALAEGVRELLNQGQTDYAFEALVMVDENKNPIGRIESGDGVVFCCRRGEREIQLTEAFTNSEFKHFSRPALENLNFAILTLYHEKFKDLPVAFAPSKVNSTLGERVSKAKLRQLRVAESEKFAHVTFFLNGGNNDIFPGEDHICIPSLKGVPFEEVPELSLAEVSQEVIKGVNQQYDLIVTNFANGDVIGHTSNPNAKIKCAEYIDRHLEKVVTAASNSGYLIFITADHGNLEELFQTDGSQHVSHTSNLVPFLVVDPLLRNIVVNDGILADIAPTILSALGIGSKMPMVGNNLIPNHNWKDQQKVLLIILDGWGLGKDNENNPIFLAHTPFWDKLIKHFPHSRLKAAGNAVGLGSNKAGNSEAGHMNIGAGRIVLQDDVRLDNAMQDGSFYTNPVLMNVINEVKKRETKLHLIGLLTEKSSHGSIDYPLTVLKMAKDHGLSDVYLHLIFDGRSTQPGSAPEYIRKLDEKLQKIGIGKIASGIGRKYALDRDGNYARTKAAYNAFVTGDGIKIKVKENA